MTAPPTIVGRAATSDALADLAAKALERGGEASAIPLVRDGAVRTREARLWQWTGLLQRSLDEHQDALGSFERAARLAPDDAKIAHGRAQIAFEAGLPAVELFDHALKLAGPDGEILVGRAAALAAVGEGERAATELRAILRRAPTWTFGHEQLAQFLSTIGRRDEATDSIEEALVRLPTEPRLWECLLRVQLRREAYESLSGIVARARSRGADLPEFALYEAIEAAELDPSLYPSPLFDAAPPEFNGLLQTWRVRHLLRLDAVDLALPIIEEGLVGPTAAELWPYAASAWRMAGDSRSTWLEGGGALVRKIDLRDAAPQLQQLADHLRTLHVAKGEYLDQSVRGGTQTDGPLFSRINPLIRRLRTAVVGAVKDYVDELPPIDPTHPLLRHERGQTIRFSGSWSVRLGAGGHHANHVHPQGWISSAFYVSLPERHAEEPQEAGWLTLGEPDARLGRKLPPTLTIEPQPGRLVLFPSWMWHGTNPIGEGERLTVAFDIRPPI